MSIQLVVPMAGRGQRFRDAGYKISKPMLPIHGLPMISVVLSNLFDERISKIVLVTRPEVARREDLENSLSSLADVLEIVELDSLSEGPADSVLSAKHLLNLDLPVVIANSDQYVNTRLSSFYDDLNSNFDGVVLCMQDDDPKWSYVLLNQAGEVEDILEKKVVSNLATVGIYGFKTARIAFAAIEEMMAKEHRTNGEFYVAPSYGYLVKKNKKIRTIDLGPVSQVMHGLGTPVDYENFLCSSVSRTASDKAQKIIGNNARP